MRGEYWEQFSRCHTFLELPPRARRILISGRNFFPLSGTTSACAENTAYQWDSRSLPRNYLRVRGEYTMIVRQTPEGEELPPRARRIPPWRIFGRCWSGTTSACAENTVWTTTQSHKSRNYLRVRGEYHYPPKTVYHFSELPPRARRIRLAVRSLELLRGTTSACAENTVHPSNQHTPHGNYLRVRGEYSSGLVIAGCMMELPPRARRIP